jgi:WD40 repeat protein
MVYEFPNIKHLYTLRGAPQSDAALKFSPDGRYRFAPEAGGSRRTLLQWDLTTGRGIRQYPIHNGPISAIAFTPDGKTMLTADDRVHRWDWQTGRGLDATLPSMTDAPTELTVSPDSRSVVTAEAGEIVARELPNGREIRRFRPADGAD